MQPTALEKPQTLSMCEHFFGFKKSSVVNSKFLFVRHCDKFRTAAVNFEKFCFVWYYFISTQKNEAATSFISCGKTIEYVILLRLLTIDDPLERPLAYAAA